MPDSKLIVPQNYAELRRAVEVALVHGQQAVEQARVRTYHETGRLIHAHVLLFQDRADYGAKTIPRLAGDLKLDRSVLLRCVQFYRAFPIVAARRQLTWGHYRLLVPVEDAAQRKMLEQATIKNEWTTGQLEEHIRPLRVVTETGLPGPAQTPAKLLTPKRGTPGVCKVIAVGAALVVDLGFACYLDVAEDAELAAGAFVRLDASGRARPAEGATKADLFTYAAEILKVVDGDTLWVKIYLRPRQWVKQKLRLRDLDCPELATPAGKAAKRFTESLVPAGTAVTICTTKPDKYDRYLADVFVDARGEKRAPQDYAPTGEIHLNNALLAASHAVLKKAWEFDDWETDRARASSLAHEG